MKKKKPIKPVFDWGNLLTNESDPREKAQIRLWLSDFWDAHRYSMSDEWKTCSKFIFYVESKIRSSYYAITRPNKLKPYGPNNIEINKLKRVVLKTYEGYEYTLKELSAKLDIPYYTMRRMLMSGIEPDNLVNEYANKNDKTYSKETASLWITEDAHNRGKMLAKEKGMSFSAFVECLILQEKEL